MTAIEGRSQTRHVVIVGGGISGLSAAWYLQQARKQGLDVRYTLVEASDRWGGKVLTDHVYGFGDEPFVVEAGPDAFLTQKPWAIQLARDLGLSERLININSQQRTTYVLHHGKPIKLPDGVALIVPTQLMPFLRSPLISWRGKLRIGMELLMPRKLDDEDETLAEFVHRRLGHEALDIFAEPMLAGIYNAESDKQSLLATFPRFRQLEREYGSVIRGTLASRRKQAASSAPKAAFMSLIGGTQELIDTLVPQLNGDLRLQTHITALEATNDGKYQLTTDQGDELVGDAVLLTTPAYTVADLLRPLSAETADQLSAIRYLSSGTVSLAFHLDDIKRDLDGFGLVIPKREQRPINAITISSVKFSHRAPQGYVLLRVFFGGSRSPESMSYDDEKLLNVVRQELRAMLGIEAVPLFHRVYRWLRANPQYDLNHLERVADIEGHLPDGIYLTGAAYRGVGMPDCVYQAQQSVNQMLDYLAPLPLTEAEVVV